MKITVTQNTNLDDPDPYVGVYKDFTTEFDTKQVLEFNIETEDGEVGRNVGLVQNLIASKRVATYTSPAEDLSGTMTIVPTAGLPCLDAEEDETRRPFYDEFATAKLPEVGKTVPVKITDNPNQRLPIRAIGPEETTGTLTQFEAEETFHAWVYDADNKNPIEQWEWKYHIVVQNSNFEKPKNSDFTYTTKEFGVATKLSTVQTPVTSGDTPGDTKDDDWQWQDGWRKPDGWK